MPHAGDYGVENVQDTLFTQLKLEGEEHGDELYILCPNPKHPDRKPSCHVNMKSGLFHCFACGIGGDLADLTALVLQVGRETAVEALKPNTPQAFIARLGRRLEVAARKVGIRPAKLELPGPYERGNMWYLRLRGFSTETIKEYGCRYVKEETFESKKGSYTIHDYIALPIRDQKGNLLAWCYRKTTKSSDWSPRYMYTPGANLKELWFGLHLHAKSDTIVITEGALDSMWVHQCGYPTLALLGSSMGHQKILWLQRYSKVVLFCDRDAAGLQAVQKIGKLLGHRMPLYVVRYPSSTTGKDPQELEPVDVELSIVRAVPWIKWKEGKTNARGFATAGRTTG